MSDRRWLGVSSCLGSGLGAAAISILVVLGGVGCSVGSLQLPEFESAGGEEPASSAASAPPVLPGAPEILAVVTVAGLSPDRHASEGDMPALASWAWDGVAAARVESVVPATAYGVHASLVTGFDTQGHGIHGDRLIDEKGLSRVRPWRADLHQTPTLWGLLQDEGRAVVGLDWPTTQGATLAAVLPDGPSTTRSVAWPASIASDTTPWLLAMAKVVPEAGRPGAERDRLLVSAACAAVSGRAPQLLMIRLRGTEAPLLQFGPESREAKQAFAVADQELARLRACLLQASPRSAVVVLGDRGFSPVHTAVRPNRVLKEAGLLGGDGAPWDAIVRTHGGSAFLYAINAEAALAARSALEAEAEARGSFRVVSAEEMITRRADPEAWFGLEAASGFALLDGYRGPPVSPAPVRASAGYFDPATSVAFVAVGQGFRSGLPVPSLHQLDVAPTLAHLLGVDLGTTEGRRLIGLLRIPGPVAAGPSGRGLPRMRASSSAIDPFSPGVNLAVVSRVERTMQRMGTPFDSRPEVWAVGRAWVQGRHVLPECHR